MATQFKIAATAPTAYQHASLQRFGLDIEKCGGSYVGTKTFDTEREAKDFLIDRAERYFENESELEEEISDIEKYGVCRLDAVTARIEEVENED